MAEQLIFNEGDQGLLPGPPVNLPESPMATGDEASPGSINIEIGAKPQPATSPDANYAIGQEWDRYRKTLSAIYGPDSESLWVPERFAYDAVKGSAVTVRNTIAAIGMGLTEGPTMATLGTARILQKAGMVDEGTVQAVEDFHKANTGLGDSAMKRLDGGGFSAGVREVAAEGMAAATIAVPAVLAAGAALPAGVIAGGAGALAWLAGWTTMGAGREVDTQNLMDTLAELGVKTGAEKKAGDSKATKINKQMVDAALMGSGIEWLARGGAKLTVAAVRQARAISPEAGPGIAAALAKLAALPPEGIRQMRLQARRGREWIQAMIDHPESLTARTAEHELAQALAARDLDALADMAEEVQKVGKVSTFAEPRQIIGWRDDPEFLADYNARLSVSKKNGRRAETPVANSADDILESDASEAQAYAIEKWAERNGWRVEDAGASDTSHYFKVTKPASGVVDEFGDPLQMEIELRVSDHANLSTQRRNSPDINIAPGADSIDDAIEKLSAARPSPDADTASGTIFAQNGDILFSSIIPAVVTTGGMASTEPKQPDGVQVAGMGDAVFRLILRSGTKEAEKMVPKGIARKADELVDAAKNAAQSPLGGRALVRKDFNLDRIATDDDIKGFINEVSNVLADETKVHTRGVQKLDDIAMSAAQLQMSPEDVLKLRTVNAEELNKARNVMVALAEQVREQAKVVGDPALYSDQEALRLRQLMTLYGAVQTHTKGLITETARALSSLRIMSQADNLSGQAIADMAQQLGGKGANIRIAKMIGSMADDPEKQARLLANAWKANGWDMFMEYYYFALLSSPTTHLVNFTSSLGTVMWGVPEHMLAAGIGALRRSMGGEGGVYVREIGSTWAGMVDGVMGGGAEAWKVLKSGEPGAIGSRFDGTEVRRAITSENLRGLAPMRATGNAFGMFDTGTLASKGFDLLGEYVVRGPSRLMMTADEFNKGLAYFMELRRRAVRQALDEGKTGTSVASRAEEILRAPEEAFPDLHIGAQNFAMETTFTAPLGPRMQAFQAAVNSVPALRLVFPFIRTPANIVKYVGERTPLAPLSSEVRRALVGELGPAAQDQAIAKITLGSTIAGVAATLAQAGYITGGGPADPNNDTATRVLKERLEATGWQEYSVRVPGTDKFVSYKRYDPFAMFLGLAADYQEVEAYMTDEERAGAAAALSIAVYRNLTNKTWLQGMQQMGDMVAQLRAGDPRAASNFVTGLAGSVAVPAGVNWINNTFFEEQKRSSKPTPYDDEGFRVDETLQVAQQIINRVKSRTPGLSGGLPPQVNWWGEPVTIRPGVEVGTSVSTLKVDEKALRGAGLPTAPMQWAKLAHPLDMDNEQFRTFVKAVGVDGEMVRLGVPVGPHPSRLMGVELSPEQQAAYVAAVNSVTPRTGPWRGLNMKQAMEKLVQSDDYAKASDFAEVTNSKVALMRKIAQAYRHDINEDPRTGFGGADRLIMEQFPDLGRLVYERKAMVKGK